MSTLYRNAKIFTAFAELESADAMAVSNGVIAAIGSEKDVLAACSEISKTIDLGGRRVLPGLIDSHMHGVVLSEYSKQISCLPPKINSIEDLIREVHQVSLHKDPDEWILGWGYDEGKLAEHRAPDRYDLDQGAPDQPVFILRTCVHIASVNSKALQLAGITKDTPDPEGGRIVRDANGEPTGILQENARNLVLDLIPDRTAEERTSDILDLGELLLSQGIVGFTDMGAFDNNDCYNSYNEAVRNGLRQDVAIYYFWDKVKKAGNYTLDETSLDEAQQIHVAGLKLIGDGSISGHTAWVKEPYLGTEEHGIYELDEGLFEDALAVAGEKNCQVCIHAMGGQTIDKVIRRLSRSARRSAGRLSAPAFRMEHITEPSERAIRIAADHNIWFSLQPDFLYSEIESYLSNLGPERTKETYPVRTLLNEGVNISLSTDAPATSWAVPSDPWMNLKAAVTRTAYEGTDCGQDQRLDIETAVILYTRNAAQICGFDRLGQLRPDYRASFIVLESDVLEIPSDEIDQVRVDCTVIDGDVVYKR